MDLRNRRVELLISDGEIAQRWSELDKKELKHESPWQELIGPMLGSSTRAHVSISQ